MTDIKDWAILQRMAQSLSDYSSPPTPSDKVYSPCNSMVEITKQDCLLGSASEIWSDRFPRGNGNTPKDEELLPIDKFYGLYCPAKNEVTIFHKQIRKDAQFFNSKPEDLIWIIRLHEFAHSFVNLSIPLYKQDEILSDMGEGAAKRQRFINRRFEWFCSQDDKFHEQLAQALTYSALLKEENETKLEAFSNLEKKQPDIYRLSDEMKNALEAADWGMILCLIQGEFSEEDLQTGGLSEILEFFEETRDLEKLICESSIKQS